MSRAAYHLRLASARLTLEQIRATEDFVDVAHEVLDGEVYSHSLGELITRTDLSGEDAPRLFRKAMDELAVPVPTPSQAMEILYCDHLLGIMEERLPVRQTLSELTNWAIDYPALDFHWDDPHYHAFRHDMVSEQSMREYLLEVEPWREQTILDAMMQHVQRWLELISRKRFRPEWVSPTVLELATTIEIASAYERLPVLADALEEAGCHDPEVLIHCRAELEHSKTCWVNRLIIASGKEQT